MMLLDNLMLTLQCHITRFKLSEIDTAKHEDDPTQLELTPTAKHYQEFNAYLK